MNIHVIIAAARESRRFGKGDKLAQDLGGRALLLRSVEIFARREEVGGVLVAAPPAELDAFRDRYAATLGFHGARIVERGERPWRVIEGIEFRSICVAASMAKDGHRRAARSGCC